MLFVLLINVKNANILTFPTGQIPCCARWSVTLAFQLYFLDFIDLDKILHLKLYSLFYIYFSICVCVCVCTVLPFGFKDGVRDLLKYLIIGHLFLHCMSELLCSCCCGPKKTPVHSF